ncbi:MAG: GlcNAc-transferase family protein, partial [Acidimicrobiales bacterium]
MGDADIFVAIAAYRDPELRLTIESCIENADDPSRLTFGVCLQYEVDGPRSVRADCLDNVDAAIRLLRYPFQRSKGGCWARHLTQSLYDGERYTLQIDSHSRMEPSWDTDLIAMMNAFPGDKPLISSFPMLYTRDAGVDAIPDADRTIVPVTMVETWSPDGWIW